MGATDGSADRSAAATIASGVAAAARVARAMAIRAVMNVGSQYVYVHGSEYHHLQPSVSQYPVPELGITVGSTSAMPAKAAGHESSDGIVDDDEPMADPTPPTNSTVAGAAEGDGNDISL